MANANTAFFYNNRIIRTRVINIEKRVSSETTNDRVNNIYLTLHHNFTCEVIAKCFYYFFLALQQLPGCAGKI